MIKLVTYYRCKCDRCSTIVRVKDLEELSEKKWSEVSGNILCRECVDFYTGLSPKCGDKVVCLIDDSKRDLRKSSSYTVCDALYASTRVTVEEYDRVNKSIYVDLGNGWQAKLTIGEYDML